MQLHQIKPKIKKKPRKRVGRGGKRGTYSGRGLKGQKARSNTSLQPAIRTFIKRYHKLRGYRVSRGKKNFAIINLSALEKKFDNGESITPEILFKKKLIRRIKGRVPLVKILGKGDLAKKLIFENCQFSKKAKEKIEKTEGTIK